MLNLFKTDFSKAFFCIILIAVAASYFPALLVGFYLDDFSSIVNNSFIKPPISSELIIQTYGMRSLAYFWFAFEVRLFGVEPVHFHLASLVLHTLVCILAAYVFYLLSRAINSSWLSGASKNKFRYDNIDKGAISIAFVGALIFSVHPQNSQAVVYVVQQIALLATLCTLCCLVCYIKARMALQSTTALVWLIASCFFFILALLTKQNTLVIPLAIFAIECIVFRKWQKKLLLIGVSSIILLFAIMSLALGSVDSTLNLLDSSTRETTDISRVEYFISQLSIVGHYVTQYFYPTGLRLEYSPIVANKMGLTEYLWLIFHATMLLFSLAFLKRAPLFALSVLLYYCFHLVESSIIPIRDLAFEHRTYLPNVWLSFALAIVLNNLYRWTKSLSSSWPQKGLVLGGVVILVFAGFHTNQRAELWQDKFAFYQNELKYSKTNPRIYMTVGQLYIDEKNCPMAIGYFEHAISLYELTGRKSFGAKPELFQNYANCLFSLGMTSKAFVMLDKLMMQAQKPRLVASIIGQKGRFLIDLKQHGQALTLLRKAHKLDGRNFNILVNLAICEAVVGDIKKGKVLLESALSQKPNHQLATQLLSQVNMLIEKNDSRQKKS